LLSEIVADKELVIVGDVDGSLLSETVDDSELVIVGDVDGSLLSETVGDKELVIVGDSDILMFCPVTESKKDRSIRIFFIFLT
jgi:hypothetical protein